MTREEIRNQLVDEYMEEEETPAEKKERLKLEKDKEKYMDGRLKGKSIQSLSDSLWVNEDLCLEWEKEFQEDSKVIKKLAIEKALNDSKLRKTDRVKNLSNLLNRINKEISKRDFSDVPTDKLILLGAKLNEHLESIIHKENNEFLGSSYSRINID
ncbi:MAG: hypothetical protein KDK36_18850 [Leptospiraceae bacterium]|nr:hypothetical protein [Leptospiraceae bacterium]